MTPEEKKELRDLALLSTFSKMRALTSISAHLRAAVETCRNWANGHHTYSEDVEIWQLKEAITKVYYQIGAYSDEVIRALTGTEPDDYEYTSGNDELRLRAKEAEARGLDVGADEDWPDPEKVPNEDPLVVFKRLNESALTAPNLVSVIAALIETNSLREQHGEDTIGVLTKCGAFKYVDTVELSRAVDAVPEEKQ